MQHDLTEKIYYNALASATIGDYCKLKKLHAQYPTWEDAWRSTMPQHNITTPQSLFLKLTKLKISLLLASDIEFPRLLREIPEPPFAIYVRGQLPTSKICIGIVGTRRATDAGKRYAAQFGATLAAAGCAIVSGLAIGIDAAAHRGTLTAHGTTLAVLACGLDTVYPAQHQQLSEHILEAGGAIISEYPLGAPAYQTRFLERNRLISGLSRGVLLVEAPQRSGALATARYALDQNRDVFVVPGPITHPNYVGSLELIKSGAMLVTSPHDILLTYNIASPTSTTTHRDLGDDARAVFDILKKAGVPLAVDKIIARSILEPRTIQQALATLLIADMIRETQGMYELC